MKVSQQKLDYWKSLYEEGDNDALSGILKITSQNVSRIRMSGIASVAKIKLINKFYEARKKEVMKQGGDINK